MSQPSFDSRAGVQQPTKPDHLREGGEHHHRLLRPRRGAEGSRRHGRRQKGRKVSGEADQRAPVDHQQNPGERLRQVGKNIALEISKKAF